MRKVLSVVFLSLLSSSFVQADEVSDEVVEKHTAIIMDKYPDAKIVEFELDSMGGKPVYEYDFMSKGEKYEAFIREDGEILRMQLD